MKKLIEARKVLAQVESWEDAESEITWTRDELGEKIGDAFEPESGVIVITFPDGTAMTFRTD